MNVLKMDVFEGLGTHHRKVNLHSRTDPKVVAVPRLIIRVDQSLPDEICPEDPGDGDDESDREQHRDADALLEWHVQAHDDRDGQDGHHEV